MPVSLGHWQGQHASERRRVMGLVGGTLLAAIATLLCFAPYAGAAEESKAVLKKVGTPNGAPGGQLNNSRGLAANVSGVGASAGSIYVAEGNPNHRISQFDKSGNFIRAWGYDVIVATRPDTTVPPNSNGTGFEVCDVTNGNVAADCKSGVAGVGAGQLNNPQGISIDQTNGFLYVTSSTNRRVDVFSGSGQFAGAFGWGVDTGAAALEFCTTVSVCQAAAAAGEAAGNLQSLNASIPAVDPTAAPGTVYVPDPGNLRVNQYATTIAGGVLTAVVFTKAFGWDVDPAGGTGLETCTVLTGCKKGSSGNGPGQFGPANGSPTAAAVDSNGSVYVASGPLVTGNCVEATPCRIQKFNAALTEATNFGPITEPGQLFFGPIAPGIGSNTVAGLSVAIDPTNDNVFILRKVSTSQYRVFEYDSAGNYIQTHPSPSVSALNGVTNNLGAGLAVGIEEKIYANMGGANLGEVVILGPLPPSEPENVECLPSAREAECTGKVTIPAIESGGVTTTYRFEYTADGENWVRIPAADVLLGSTPGEHTVDVTIDNLSANTLYLVRLCAITAKTICTDPPTPVKTLSEGPRVLLTFADEITQTSAELGAHVNPGGLRTSYYFEWGPTTAYGNRIPATTERDAGSGVDVIVAKEPITGLDAQAVYHFRVVATNSKAKTNGDDEEFETLNSCGLTDSRCFELVSPAKKGPVAGAGDVVALGAELRFQAAPVGPEIAYEIAYGLPDSTAGNEVLYRAERTSIGWSSLQLAPPVRGLANTPASSTFSFALGLSNDLKCGIYASTQPLTSDTPKVPLQAGSASLYRGESGADWEVISNLEPLASSTFETALEEFVPVGMSPDCNRVVFRSPFHYPTLPGTGKWRLYQWDNGVLSIIGRIPGGGPTPPAVSPGAFAPNVADLGNEDLQGNKWNAVSSDASRIYFTAVSQEGGDAGRKAVFLSENGDVGVDVSQSRAALLPGGSVNNDDSSYQIASEDGSQVFFQGRYGLAANGAETAAETSTGATSCAGDGTKDGTGCDLYRYSVDEERLVDISVPEGAVEEDLDTKNSSGASVVGVLGAADDGSYVYFAARGKLLADEGPLQSANLATNEYSVYLWNEGTVEYVAQLKESDLGKALVGFGAKFRVWSARVTPDGEHLLFESRASVTGYQGGAIEAYLYDASADSVTCVSCRRDGAPSVAPPNQIVLPSFYDTGNQMTPPQTLSKDGDRVYFISRNRLAVGATEGRSNLYQWENGQISFIANSPSGSGFDLQFAGASEDGDELYFTTLNRLTWNDKDGQLDLYDAKVGGGFAAPVPPVVCDPLTESSCQGAPGPGGPAAVPPASAALAGAGNVPPSAGKPSKPSKRPKKKKKKKGKGKKQQRAAKQTGRASK